MAVLKAVVSELLSATGTVLIAFNVTEILIDSNSLISSIAGSLPGKNSNTAVVPVAIKLTGTVTQTSLIVGVICCLGFPFTENSNSSIYSIE